MLLSPRMVFLFFIIQRNRGEEKVQGAALALALAVTVHTPWLPRWWLVGRGFAQSYSDSFASDSLDFSYRAVIPRDWKAENWEWGGKKKRFFLSCSRVTEFLQLPVYLKTYYRNNSFPVFIIHILSSYWLFVTTPSLLSGKLFSAGRMKMYSVSLPYSCFASWCCATPEIVIPWPVSSNVDLDLRDCVLSKIHDLKKKLYLISLAERS